MLKGTTKIELTDVNTGETQVIEKHNNITGALQEIFNPILGHLTDEAKLSSVLPAYSTLFGGLLLFDGRIDGDPLPVFAPEGVNLIGCARYNTASTLGSKYVGSYDANESVMSQENKTAKFVYNFTQSQANGTINSVCLTHRNGGYGVYKGDVGIKNNTVKLANSVYAVPTTRLVRGSRDRSNFISGVGNTEYLYAVDVDNDVVHYFRITSATTLVVLKRKLGLKQYSLFGDNDAIIGDPITITLSNAITTSGSYNTYCFDVEEKALYIISTTSTSSISAAPGAQFLVTKFKLGETVATQSLITNQHTKSIQVPNAFVYRGRVYTTDAYVSTTINGSSAYLQTVVSHSLSGTDCSTHGTIVNASSSSYAKPQFAMDGRLYWQSNYTTTQGIGGLQVTDCEAAPADDNTTLCGLDVIEIVASNSPAACTPVIGHPMLMYLSAGSTTTFEGFHFLSHYLATVNNLSTPIVKAPTQTMKITYTIQEV